MRTKKIRFVFMVAAGIVITFLLDSTMIGGNHPHEPIYDFLVTIGITILTWEGNLRIDSWMDKLYPWDKVPGKRILTHLPLSLIYSVSVIYFSISAFNYFVCPLPSEIKDPFIYTALVMGVLISIMILAIEISTQFFVNWKRSLVDIEKYKAESLQAQLQNLKDQINPHFLFNNMSVLSSLVYKDQDKAVDFINQLSKVYRYLLDTRSTELVSLRDELTFIESYTYLLRIRFDTSLNFEIEIPKEAENLLLPPMALQILIENAIKHNEVSSELPLTIHVKAGTGELEVSNNLQLRTVSETSSKTGLQNIKDRYLFFTEQSVDVTETKTTFTVKIPLLRSK